MTSRARVVIALFLLCLAGGLITGRGLFYNLSYVWGGLLALTFLSSRVMLRGITLRRQARSSRAQVGRPFKENFWLRNQSRIPKFWIAVRDQSDLPGHRASSVITHLGSRAERSWLVRTLCTRRGRFRIGPSELSSVDPFGLFPVRRIIPHTQSLVVLPMTLPLNNFPIPSGRLPGGEALRQTTHQITPNAAGVRDYLPGDSFNRIHWLSTARRMKLISKEFEIEPFADVWIVLDIHRDVTHSDSNLRSTDFLGRLIKGRINLPLSTVEYGVASAASIGLYILERDRAAGLLAHGQSRHVVQPDRGEAQLYRILESLAVYEANSGLDLWDVMQIEGSRMPRGSTVVIITADTSKAVTTSVRHLNRRGLYPVVVLLDEESFGGSVSSETLQQSLERNGIVTRLVRCGDPLAQSLSGALPSKPFIHAA